VHWLHPDSLSADHLAAGMVDALTSPLEAVTAPDLSGRHRAAALLHADSEFAAVPASTGG
jgi:hypothetical protein